jgi:hypothetical protein
MRPSRDRSHEAVTPTTPTVSVLLPVYNGAPWLAEAVESILGQSFTDFELIVVNDGSRDDSEAIVKRYHDERLRYYHHDNQGLARTLNRAIELARGRYLARQDQDDISRPERLRRQVEYLTARPECALLGTWAEIWNSDGPTISDARLPTESSLLKLELLFSNPFFHSSVMIRRAALDAAGGYSTDPARQPPEDYELWSRLARDFEVANLPERLLVYREVPGSMSRSADSGYHDRVVKIASENLLAAIEGVSPATARGVARLHLGANLERDPVSLSDCADLLRRVARRMRLSDPPRGREIGRRLRKKYLRMVCQYYEPRLGPLPARVVAAIRHRILTPYG